MKMKSLLSALIVTALLAFARSAAAHGGDDDEHGSNKGCDIDGHEVMKAVVFLTATTNAPAGAFGVAKIEAEHEDGEDEAELELKLVGLTDGDYILSLTLLPEGTNTVGTNVVLGLIPIGMEDDNDCDKGHHNWNWWHHKFWKSHGDDDDDDHDGDEDGDDDNDHPWIRCNWGGFTNWGCWTNWSFTNCCNLSNKVSVVKVELDLPAGLNPASIAQIILSDTNGNAILVGDLVKPATNTVINISADVRLTPCAGAPSSSGMAQLRSTALKGKWSHQFNLTASGMGAKTGFRVFLNGKKAGATKSDKTGQLTIKRLPGRVPAVRSLRLFDAKGNEAARVAF
jgi:hypothetical protein